MAIYRGPGPSNPAVPVSSNASRVEIVDSGGYFTSDNVEGALDEIGNQLGLGGGGSVITSGTIDGVSIGATTPATYLAVDQFTFDSRTMTLGGADILVDVAGTTTLSNIDALDATTIATMEAAMELNIDTLSGVTMTSSTIDSTTIGATTPSTGAFTDLSSTGTTSFPTGTTIGNLTLANGSITDSGGTIDFGNENLVSTGTGTFNALDLSGGSSAITNTGTGTAAFMDFGEFSETTNNLTVRFGRNSSTAGTFNTIWYNGTSTPVVTINHQSGAITTTGTLGSNSITSSGFITLFSGSTPATGGAVRIPNNNGVYWRNFGNTADSYIRLNVNDDFEFYTDAANQLVLSSTTADFQDNAITTSGTYSYTGADAWGLTIGGSGTDQLQLGVFSNVCYIDAASTTAADSVLALRTANSSGTSTTRLILRGDGTIATAGATALGAEAGSLTVSTGSHGAAAASGDADDIVIQSDGQAGLSVLTPDINISRVWLGSQSDTTGGKIEWYYGTAGAVKEFTIGSTTTGGQTVLVSSNAAEAMRIDSNQDVGIGTLATPSARLHVKDSATTVFEMESTDAGGTGPILITYSNSTSPADNDVIWRIQCRSNTDNGAGAVATSDQNNGSIIYQMTDTGDTTETGEWVFQTRQAGSGVNNRFYIADDCTVASGNLVIGTSGKGIDFSATSDATGMTSELLDDYEEGTWTPVLSDGTNSDATQTVEVGRYTKIGQMVHIKGKLHITSLGSVSGNLRINGLPFTSNGTANTHSTGVVGVAANLNLTAGENLTLNMGVSVTYINLRTWNSTGGSTVTTSTEFSADGQIEFSGTYYV